MPLAVPALGAAQDVAPALTRTYLCHGGAVLRVAYINPETGPSLAVVGWAGKLVPMQAGPTGSGVRYIASDEQASYRWHVKGPDDALLFLAAAEEETILSDCSRVGDTGQRTRSALRLPRPVDNSDVNTLR